MRCKQSGTSQQQEGELHRGQQLGGGSLDGGRQLAGLLFGDALHNMTATLFVLAGRDPATARGLRHKKLASSVAQDFCTVVLWPAGVWT
jgi:hypothetical protein